MALIPKKIAKMQTEKQRNGNTGERWREMEERVGLACSYLEV